VNKTLIEWCDYTVNPVKGYCPVGCPYCYARRMYDRFKWDKTIRYEQDAWYKPVHVDEIDPGQKIFVGSTIELFGDWVCKDWLDAIMYEVNMHADQTFIFLTKQPQNLQKWSPFPENAWVGVSATNQRMFEDGRYLLHPIQAKVKFLSVEPLLDWEPPKDMLAWHYNISSLVTRAGINWLIIGAETGNRKGKPPLEQVQGWAREIIHAADEAGIPVFCKNNLKMENPRQEFPGVKP